MAVRKRREDKPKYDIRDVTRARILHMNGAGHWHIHRETGLRMDDLDAILSLRRFQDAATVPAGYKYRPG